MRSRWKAPHLPQLLLWDTLGLQLASCCHGLGAPAWSLISDGDTGPSAREKRSDKGLTRVAQVKKVDTKK